MSRAGGTPAVHGREDVNFAMHSEWLGYPTSCWNITMTPNVTRPPSRGRVSLASADPDDPPLIDYRWFTDSDGHD